MVEQDAVDIAYEADVGRREEDRSHRTPRHRSGSQCDADKKMGKDGFHQGGPDNTEFKTESIQVQSHLCGRENSNNSPPDGKTASLHEFSGG